MADASETALRAEAKLTRVGGSRSFASFRSISALVLREMSTSYGKSPGGYLWAIVEPVASITLLTTVFSLMLRSPPLGINFPIFYATGMLPFILYNSVGNKITHAILYSRPLLIYPSVTFVDALIARFILNFLTALLVSYLVFSGIRILYETRTTLDFPGIMLGFAMSGALALGVGTLNCFLVSMFPLWERVWGILTAPLLILSCVFYTYDTVPGTFRTVLWYNPLVHIVGQTRSGFYATYDAPYVNPLYVFSISLICGVLGLIFLRRFHRIILYP